MQWLAGLVSLWRQREGDNAVNIRLATATRNRGCCRGHVYILTDVFNDKKLEMMVT
jgi:hypothetical protein